MKTLITALAILLLAATAQAKELTIEFDHSPVKEVASYQVYVDDQLFATASVNDVLPETGYYRMVFTGIVLQYDIVQSFKINTVFADGSIGDFSGVITGIIPRPEVPVVPEVPPTLRRVIFVDDDGSQTILEG